MIPFNKPFICGNEHRLIKTAIDERSLSGDGSFTSQCTNWLKTNLGANFALLTQSATAALEMAAMLAELQSGDEVIMPSYTFVSTANAVVLRGGVPVFIDIRSDTLNMDERLVEQAISPRTKALIPVHYAGVACEMDSMMAVARKHGLLVIEDAAQGIMSSYKGQSLGTIGDMGAISFHATKNINCGEGGAFITNLKSFGENAEIIREKGTDRSKFFRGEVDKYSWVSVGSSFLPSEINAAFLLAQLSHARTITESRLAIWQKYHEAFQPLEMAGMVQRPRIPKDCVHNGHIYWIALPTLAHRTDFINQMKAKGVGCSFHYVPLHSTPQGHKCARIGSDMKNTNHYSDRLVRFPLYPGLEPNINYVIDQAVNIIRALVQ